MWGPPPGGDRTVCRSFGIRTSSDADRSIKPGHGLCQADGCQSPEPESAAVDRSPAVGLAGAQVKLEQQAALLEPGPPATGGAPVGRRAGCAGANRSAAVPGALAALTSHTSGVVRCTPVDANRCADIQSNSSGRSAPD